MNENYNELTQTLDEMLTYFNKLYAEHDNIIQEYKAKLFEINVRLDEINKTRGVYTFNTDYRKNIFSPLSSDTPENDKEKALKEEIKKLHSERLDYEEKITLENASLKKFEKKIKKLSSSKLICREMIDTLERQEKILKLKETYIPKPVEQETEIMLPKKEVQEHLKNIMMLETFDENYYATVLDKRIRNNVYKNNQKLNSLERVLYSDPGQSKIIADEIIDNQKQMLKIMDDQLDMLNYGFDDKKNLKTLLREYVDEKQKLFPDIEFKLEVTELLYKPSYVRYTALYKLLNIFVDNVIKHSHASKVNLKVSEDNGLYTIVIHDNGYGLRRDYMSKVKWYSGIHRAKEIIYMIDGKLEINGSGSALGSSITPGTKVTFSFNYE